MSDNKVMIYNPKTFGKNNKSGSPITDFRWLGGKWQLGVNKIAKFIPEVASEMLKRFEFLTEVKPEDLKKIKVAMKSKTLTCEYCEYSSDSKKELHAHNLGKHKMSAENKELVDSVPDADAEIIVKHPLVQKDLSSEELEGIPDTKDLGEREFKDDWYGKGIEKDIPSSMGIKPRGQMAHYVGS